jgi:hypothetical protein
MWTRSGAEGRKKQKERVGGGGGIFIFSQWRQELDEF